jgi:hypothetical protein
LASEDSWLNIAAGAAHGVRHEFSLGDDPAKNCQQ